MLSKRDRHCKLTPLNNLHQFIFTPTPTLGNYTLNYFYQTDKFMF